MNEYLRDKLKVISFFSMIMVVYLHSYNLIIKMSGDTHLINNGYNSFIQDFVSNGLTRIAVPLFFIISGYLFFLSIENGYISEFLVKYKKRIYTLLIPYLLWSVFGILFYLFLQTIPISKPFFTKELIKDYSLADLLYVIFYKPISYQLWFVRDLIILVFLSPIIFWFLKYFKYYFILLLLITWLIGLDYILFSNEALLFFVIGSFFSTIKVNFQKLKFKNQYLFFSISWMMLVLCKTVLTYIGFENSWVLIVLHKTSIFFGISAIWFSYDKLFENKDVSNLKIYPIFKYSFFLYAFHEPILTVFKKVLYFILGTTELTSFIIYLSAPIFTIFLVVLCGFYLKTVSPRFYSLMTGGR